ncbi:MAG TPA: molecular chaperone SurA, partial [Chromatiales bacterium]|nr:molecular chaperone SurA [Chromatiales bacterium]
EVAARARAGEDFAALAVAHSDGQKALEGGDLGWRKADELPSIFADVVPRMEPGEVSGVIRSPSGFHIVKLLEVRGDEPHVVEQVRLRQILLRPGELLSEEEARLRLEQLRERVLAGEPFEALARAHSEDAASAARGGDMGWLAPAELPPQVAEAIRGLGPGEVSRPFRTPAGWHLVQLVERRRSDDTEAYRRARARKLLRQRKVEERLQLWLRRLRDEAYVELRLDR